MTGTDGPFSRDALDTNRAGRLSDAQRDVWRRIVRERRKGSRGLAWPVGGIGVLLLVANGPASKALMRQTFGLGFLAFAAALLFVGTVWQGALATDVEEGRVKTIEGAISKRKDWVGTGRSSARRYYIDVAGLSLLTGVSAYDAAPDAGIVRVFYLPRSRRLVNLERLPDRPLPESPSDVKRQIIDKLEQGIRGHDEVAMAEARAAASALQAAVSPQPSNPPPPDRLAARDPDAFARALEGSWTNRLLTVEFGADGRVTITLPLGAPRTGRWSVDANGKLIADFTGEAQATDAWIERDQLTISFAGEQVTLRRRI